MGLCICSHLNILKEKILKLLFSLKKGGGNLFPDTSNNKFELLGFDTFVSNYIVAKGIVANNGASVSQ